MLQLRIRPVNDDGSTGASTRAIKTEAITWTGVHSAVSSLRFQASRDEWEPTEYPFVVRVEYSVDGGTFAPLPEHDLFIFEKDSDDSKDDAKIVSYEGVLYVPWILAGSYVVGGQWGVDGKRTVDNGPANAGRIFDYFFTEIKGRGPWLEHLSWNFNGTRDSANVLWQVSDREELAWKANGDWYHRMLQTMTEQALCEWSTAGTELLLFRHNTHGADRSAAVHFGGKRFDRVPVTTDASGQYSHVVSQFDNGRGWVWDESFEGRFGRRSIHVSHTGVETRAASERLSQRLLAASGQQVRREEAYEWQPGVGDFAPFRDFNLGDLVSATSRGAKRSRRVVGIIVTQTADRTTVQARVGEKISTLAAKTQKKLDSITGGGISGGTGGSFPTSPAPEPAPPAQVIGLHVVSNTAAWTPAGPVAQVELAWSPVTSSTDDEETVIREYQLYQDGAPAQVISNGTTVTVEIPSQSDAVFRVAAVNSHGHQGDWSQPVTVTGAVPEPVTLTPSGLTLTAGSGSVVATWDGSYLESVLDGAMAVRVEARVQGDQAWSRQGVLTEAGGQLITVGTTGDTVEVRLVALDRLSRETGTGNTVSITRVGVEYDDLDQFFRDRISTLEDGTQRVMQTADGLNRIFVSPTEPGGPYVGFPNLAPPIVRGDPLLLSKAVYQIHDDDPDFEPATTGFVTGYTVAGFDYSAESGDPVLIYSALEDGTPALRVLNNVTFDTSIITFPVPDDVLAGGIFSTTAIYGVYPSAPDGCRIAVGSTETPMHSGEGPYQLRVEFGEVAEGTEAQLYTSGATGAGVYGNSMWFADLHLYTADLPDDADVLHQGDLWWKTSPEDPLKVLGIRVWDGEQWRPYEIVAENIIVTDSITAEKIFFDEGFFDRMYGNEAAIGRISTDLITPLLGEQINIRGNVVIQALSDDLETQSTTFRVTAEGAEIVSHDASSVLRLTSDGIQIIQGGTVQSRWEAGLFEVAAMRVIRQAEIGNHIFYRQGTRRTLVQPIEDYGEEE